ncbi:hypothetical protein D9M68_937990 [compost metagenome]
MLEAAVTPTSRSASTSVLLPIDAVVVLRTMLVSDMAPTPNPPTAPARPPPLRFTVSLALTFTSCAAPPRVWLTRVLSPIEAVVLDVSTLTPTEPATPTPPAAALPVTLLMAALEVAATSVVPPALSVAAAAGDAAPST